MRPLILLSMMLASALQQVSDSDQLRALIKATPLLPVERVELKIVNPPLTLVGISAVTADAKGNIYVIHRPTDGSDPVVVVDQKGNLIRSWGKGMYKTPHGIRIDAAGNVWTIDANTSNVYKFTPEGKKLLEIAVGEVPDPTREFCGATDIAFAKNGHVFISDGYCNGRVLEYDAAGKRLNVFGTKGTGPGQFNTAHAIGMSPQGNLYVADRENGRLQWFDQQGKFLGEWKYGGQFYTAVFGQNGDFYAATHPKGVSLDAEFNVVKIDLATGKILGKFEVRSHELGIAPDGTLLPATRGSELLLLKPKK